MKIAKVVTVFMVLLSILSACTTSNNKLEDNPLFQKQFTNVTYIRIYETTATDVDLFYSKELSDIKAAQICFNNWDAARNQTECMDTACRYVIQFGSELEIHVSESSDHYGWYRNGETYVYCFLPKSVIKFIESKL